MKLIHIKVSLQCLILQLGDNREKRYPISTAIVGLGEINGSGKTPRGWHSIRAKIGAELPKAAVLSGRRWTGEIYTAELGRVHPTRDWILSRILWLSGLQAGLNRGGSVDTFSRYIYIHGCPDDTCFDQPGSHGCIRMYNQDVIELFELVDQSVPVFIDPF